MKVPRGRPGCTAERNCLCFRGNGAQCGKGRMRWELPEAGGRRTGAELAPRVLQG